MTGVLLYDADCGFCTRTATWLVSRGCTLDMTPWQRWPHLAEHGITDAAAAEALHAVDGDRIFIGHRAVAHALACCPSRALRAAGALIAAGPLDPLASRAYSLLANHRHQLPGGTAQCRPEENP